VPAAGRGCLLARLAVEDCLQLAEFGDVVICLDQFSELKTAGATYQHVPDFPTKREYCEYIWYGVPSLVQTPYALLIQWDSWILDPVAWRTLCVTESMLCRKKQRSDEARLASIAARQP
jgi:hypothetical protein